MMHCVIKIIVRNSKTNKGLITMPTYPQFLFVRNYRNEEGEFFIRIKYYFPPSASEFYRTLSTHSPS